MLYYFESGNDRHMLREGPHETIRALAHHSQVRMLEKFKGNRVEVCSVSLLDRDNLGNPDEVLDFMTKVNSEPEVGGFRLLSQTELAALKMGTYRNGVPDAAYMELFAQHPFVRAGGLFPFVGNVSTWLFTFLNYIYDIRRFYDKRLRQQNLQREFGLLTSNNLVRFFKEQTTDQQTLRPMLTFQAWAVHPLSSVPRDGVEAVPEAFLQRERLDYYDDEVKRHGSEQATQKALWRVTVRFLKFVELLWIEGLGGAKFDPQRFFLHRDDADSFSAFISQLDLRVDNSNEGN